MTPSSRPVSASQHAEPSGRNAAPGRVPQGPAETAPTLDEWVSSAVELAGLVRKALDRQPGVVVKRGQLRKALERFESVDYQAL